MASLCPGCGLRFNGRGKHCGYCCGHCSDNQGHGRNCQARICCVGCHVQSVVADGVWRGGQFFCSRLCCDSGSLVSSHPVSVRASTRHRERSRSPVGTENRYTASQSFSDLTTTECTSEPCLPLQASRDPTSAGGSPYCVVCEERIVNMAFSPCGHTVLCNICSSTLERSNPPCICPVCRSPGFFMRLYLR